jgi:hypothetical protein
MTDIKGRVAQYVALRDKAKEIEERHKAELKPLKDTMEMIGGLLQKFMEDNKTDAIKTEAGTCYTTTRSHAALADAEAFKQFVIGGNHFDMLDWKANSTAVRDYIKEHKAQPPGVNFTTIQQIGVRRS